MATIASKMGLYTQSRVQFEPRDEKREAIGKAPLVDAADQRAHIGQWSIQGYGATDLTDDIEYALEHPEKFGLPMQVESEHYADFVVDMPIEASFTRERVATATARILGERSMRITRQAVSVMQAFTGSIHDVTKALFFKSSEDGRHVRVDDLKYALSTLPKSRIVPERGSKRDEIGDTAHPSRYRPSALAAQLCERAGVSPGTFAGHGDKRSHRDELAAFGLIRETESGWVVCLTYRGADFDATTPGGRPDALPFYAVHDGEGATAIVLPTPTAGRTLSRGYLRGGRRARTDGRTRRPGPPRHRRDLRDVHRERLRGVADARPEWRTLLNAACAFVGDDPMGIGGDPDPLTTVATIGREPEQNLSPPIYPNRRRRRATNPCRVSLTPSKITRRGARRVSLTPRKLEIV